MIQIDLNNTFQNINQQLVIFMTENNSQRNKISLKKIVAIPAFVGLTIGFLAAFVQALLASAGGPEAYGFCVACHTRDMVNSAWNFLFGTSLTVAPISVNAVLSTLTPLGVVIGGLASSLKNKEFRIKKSNLLSYVIYLIGGIAVMMFGLMLGACPYRAALRTGYGDMIALIGIVAIFLGVFVGSRFVLIKMKKEVV